MQQAEKPPVQAGCSPLTGFRPPVEHQFKKGQSGNPLGRRLSKILAAELDSDSEAKAMIRALLEKAKAGDVRALELAFDRSEGKLVQRNENEEISRIVVIESGSEETPK